MAQNYVKIPKDLSLIKQKFILGLTKRQAISFGIGAVMGFTAFYICNTTINFQAACFALGIFAFPAIFCGIFNKNGMHFEQIVKLMISFFLQAKNQNISIRKYFFDFISTARI